jgi:hypothetical protein
MGATDHADRRSAWVVPIALEVADSWHTEPIPRARHWCYMANHSAVHWAAWASGYSLNPNAPHDHWYTLIHHSCRRIQAAEQPEYAQDLKFTDRQVTGSVADLQCAALGSQRTTAMAGRSSYLATAMQGSRGHQCSPSGQCRSGPAICSLQVLLLSDTPQALSERLHPRAFILPIPYLPTALPPSQLSATPRAPHPEATLPHRTSTKGVTCCH